MGEIIKAIRELLGMSQSDIAKLLNVSFATVNRWENNRTVPSKVIQSGLFELCKSRNISVYNLVLQKIKHTADMIELRPGHILLYHGSKSGIKGKIRPISRRQCDFGQGFYMGTEPGQALTLICDYDDSKFYILSVDLESLQSVEIPANIDWAMLVAYNRGKMDKIQGTPLYDLYRNMSSGKDLIIGSIANDRMFYVIDNFFVGNITDMALVHSLSALQLGKQYVAITQVACDAVQIEAEIPLSHLERLAIKELAEENRLKGVSCANQICKEYRREGLFFDEILDQN